MPATPILFAGESWLGSSARSLREALARQGLTIQEWSDDRLFPHWRHKGLRVLLRVLRPVLAAAARDSLLREVHSVRPRVAIVYKGVAIPGAVVREMRQLAVRTVNVYPDYSPLVYGSSLRRALGEYDLVVSTKVWHPDAWRPMFEYDNRCVFVPHGYDPHLHRHHPEWATVEPEWDVGLIATYRPEYGRLIAALGALPEMAGVRVAVLGDGWPEMRALPRLWTIGPPVHGQAYVRAALNCRVMIAPVTREVSVNGRRYPGDEDSTRTYELPAIGLAMVHRRTAYVRQVLQEGEEVLLYDTPEELATCLTRLLREPALRASIALAGHSRVTRDHSLDVRARTILSILDAEGWL